MSYQTKSNIPQKNVHKITVCFLFYWNWDQAFHIFKVLIRYEVSEAPNRCAELIMGLVTLSTTSDPAS